MNILNAGFGQPIGRPLLRELKGLGFRGIRQDVPWDIPGPKLDRLLKELAKEKLYAILIVGGWMVWHGDGDIRPDFREGPMPPPQEIANFAVDVSVAANRVGLAGCFDIGNEPTLTHELQDDPRRYAAMIQKTVFELGEIENRLAIMAGSVHNIDPERREYLDDVKAAGWPPGVIVGVHPYRTTVAPWESFSGFNKPEDAAAWLRDFSNDNFAISECGWHTAPSTKRSGLFGWKKTKVQFTDAEVTDFAKWELGFWRSQGSRFYVWFQINDGPDPNNYEHRFGIRYLDGKWKPVSEVFGEVMV